MLAAKARVISHPFCAGMSVAAGSLGVALFQKASASLFTAAGWRCGSHGDSPRTNDCCHSSLGIYRQAAAVQQFPCHSVWAAACRRQRFAGCICKHTFCVDTCDACHAYPVIINFV